MFIIAKNQGFHIESTHIVIHFKNVHPVFESETDSGPFIKMFLTPPPLCVHTRNHPFSALPVVKSRHRVQREATQTS